MNFIRNAMNDAAIGVRIVDDPTTPGTFTQFVTVNLIIDVIYRPIDPHIGARDA